MNRNRCSRSTRMSVHNQPDYAPVKIPDHNGIDAIVQLLDAVDKVVSQFQRTDLLIQDFAG